MAMQDNGSGSNSRPRPGMGVHWADPGAPTGC